MIRTVLAAVIFALTALTLGAGPRTSNIYRNAEFGIALPQPDGAFRCPIPKGEHDQGPVFLLAKNTGAQDCRDVGEVEQHRYIEVFAEYNAVDSTKTLPSFLRSECTGVADGSCASGPGDLGITGLDTMSARVNRSDGWIYIIVVTQAGKPDPAFDPSVPSVNYSLTLHTKPQTLQEDLQTFRRILQTIRLSPPNK